MISIFVKVWSPVTDNCRDLFFMMSHPSSPFNATDSLIGSNGVLSSYWVYSATILGYFVIIHLWSSKLPVDIAAHVSTWHMKDTSSASVLPNRRVQPGNLLSTVSGIGAHLSSLWFRIGAVITNNLPRLLGESSAKSLSFFLLCSAFVTHAGLLSTGLLGGVAVAGAGGRSGPYVLMDPLSCCWWLIFDCVVRIYSLRACFMRRS